jgi:C-terminal processing protease CtpA/Prc
MTDDLLPVLTNLSLNKDLKGLILDLRISNAASGWPLQSMLSLFEDGNVGEIYNRTQSQALQITGQDVHGSQKIPLVILVGENTKGLSEVFTAAMQAAGRAKVVGSTTTGDIETLNGYLLPDGSQIFIADASFRFSGQDQIGKTGIVPDVLVDSRWDQILSNQDPVIDAAMQAFDEDAQ